MKKCSTMFHGIYFSPHYSAHDEETAVHALLGILYAKNNLAVNTYICLGTNIYFILAYVGYIGIELRITLLCRNLDCLTHPLLVCKQ
jgi:hypothetical protein